MPIIYAKTVVQPVIPPTNDAAGFPSKIVDWLANACENYLHMDHWKIPEDGLKPASRYGIHAGAHINSIPVEILGEIFMHCLAEIIPIQTTPLPNTLSPSSQADPQILGEVCRFWRDVALSTPALWSKMWIYEPQRAQVQRVAMWLDRSRGCPLDITIVQFVGNVTLNDHASMDDILSLLVGQVHRWRKVHFRFASTVQQALLALPLGAPMALESAYVDTWKWEHTSADRFWKVLHSSPSLRHVEWASYTKELPSHAPWEQLTSIIMHHGLSVEECMSILKGCQHLITFRVHALWSYDALVDPYGPLILPKLQNLSFLGCIETTPLFNRVTLPSLIALEITTTHPHRHDERRSCTSFRELLRRSSCSLDRFRLSNSDINEEDLYDYLSAPQMHSLKELELFVPITDRMMVSLTRDSDGATNLCLLPNLEAICIDKTCTSDGRISDMILSRMVSNTTTPLKTARVRFKAQSYPRDLAVFQSVQYNDWLHVFAT